MDNDFAGRWVKKFRVLTLILIFSGALNIGFLAAFIFFMLKDRQTSFSIPVASASQASEDATNGQIFADMAKLSFRELVTFLTDRNLVEEGYSKRDLALAALVGFYHFNLEKALSGTPAQVRTLQLPNKKKIDVFPGLSEDQFQAIVRYAYQEKWPVTPKGLFALLQKLGLAHDESLIQAFVVTPEFYALQILFQKTDAPQDPAVLVRLVSEGNWDLLERFAQEQTQMLDLSVEKRRRLLLSYLAIHSPTAAQLLLRTDFVFALKRLDDQGIIDLLALLKEKTQESERFCVELLRSPRSDTIWQASARLLYAYTGETATGPFDPKSALSRFTSSAEPTSPAPPVSLPPATATRLHVVKEGENLWKICRQYKIKMEDLVQLNDLEKDRLYPGMTLRLPQGTGSEPPR
jgi:LysM repeat protein